MKNTAYVIYRCKDPYELPLAVLDSPKECLRWLFGEKTTQHDVQAVYNAIAYGWAVHDPNLPVGDGYRIDKVRLHE